MFQPLPKIGNYQLTSPLILAPMAGVTDRLHRNLCRQFGASLAVSEMVTSDVSLWETSKSKHRLPHQDDLEPRAVQIAGTDPEQMALAAKMNVELGAQLIDINMGCPAKKVCRKAAGSALMRNEELVSQILKSVVSAVNVPVTLKIRTGWDHEHKNALNIAKIAEESGISALAIHGRTRADFYKGDAEYDTIAHVKQSISIPVFANGDINTPEKAKFVLEYTKADALLIGRASQGNPWIFKEINTFLHDASTRAVITINEKKNTIISHLMGLYALYGDTMGVKFARKHVTWYLSHLSNEMLHKTQFNQLQSKQAQLEWLEDFFYHSFYAV